MANGSRHCAWLWLVIVVILLNGCSHLRSKDGPPNYEVDESKVPNAVPKVEPLSKSGNSNSYKVFGKRYYVMKTSHNYEERGVASWYGTAFHTRHTSNGERYNMLAMTAAHKTLPLPTYVEVTNLRNGKKVIVKINDRGPFESNRLIDLSYVAAKKLGMLGHGTAHVNVKAVDPRDGYFDPSLIVKKQPAPNPTEYANNTYPNGHLRHLAKATPLHQPSTKTRTETAEAVEKAVYLQVGSFHNKTSAERVKRKLDHMLEKTPVNIHTSAHRYRVKVGPFKDMASASDVSKRLQAMGLHHQQVSEEIEINQTL